MKIAITRLKIYFKWSALGYLIFFCLNYFVPEFFAFALAFLITVASFLDKSNHIDHKLLKQPRMEIYHGSRT